MTLISDIHRKLSARLFTLNKWRKGEGSVLRYLEEYQRTQFESPDVIRQRQLIELRKIVRHATENCPFYNNRFAAAGVSSDTLQTLDDLTSLPILEKRDIQQNKADLTATNWHRSDLIPNFTGGSTGEPLALFVNQNRLCSREAATKRHDMWAGYQLGSKVALIWGAAFDAPQSSLKARLGNALLDRKLFFNSGHMTEAGILRFHQQLNSFQPDVVLAYAQSIAIVARYMKEHGLVPHRPKGIITSAENLSETDRELVEEVFNATVFNRYGCREVSVIASECDHGSLHTMAECLIVEVVDSAGKPVPFGATGNILVTDLFNYAMPLIRYRVGDVGALSPNTKCQCGRSLPIMDRIEGRVTDFLVGGDGRLVSGPYCSLYLTGKCPSLGKVQIIQETAGEIVLKVTQMPGAEDMEFIHQTGKRMFGETVKIDLEVVDSIPTTASGKQLLCKSTATLDFMPLNTTKDAGQIHGGD